MFDKIKKFFDERKVKKEAKKYIVKNELADAKTAATLKKEPWVSVLDTHVNPENPRNGFFELDWNEYFVLMLTKNGYRGTTEEEIVDQWFQDLCREIGAEDDINMERRGSGFVTRALREDGKVEIS
jgi:hypothetical protein